MQGQHLQAFFLDVDFVLIDELVGLHDFVSQVVAAVSEGLRRLVDHLLHHGRNVQKLRVQ